MVGRARVGVALALAGALGLALLRPAFTTPRWEAGAVSQLERIALNGAAQAVLTRGRDADAPVVLFLHGGPGAASMPFFRRFSGALEEDFVVVHWDQRGAGGSCGVREGRSLAQVISDAEALIGVLRERFGVDRVAVVGQSWGTIPGVLLAQSRPDLLWAYVGEGQVVDQDEADRLGHRLLSERATLEGDAELIRLLSSMKPPYREVREEAMQRQMLLERGAVMARPGANLAAVAVYGLLAPELRLVDKLRYPLCMASTAQAMHGDYANFVLRERGALPIPAAIFAGSLDFATPSVLAAGLAEQTGAKLVWFEGVGHVPSLEDPARFQAELRDFLLDAAARGGVGRRLR